MVLTRSADAEVAALEAEGVLRGSPVREPFREAGPVGTAHALRRADDRTGDVYAPTARTAGAWLLFGLSLDEYFRAYVEGRLGPARGAGAALHHVDLDRGFLAPVAPFGILAEVVGGLALGFRLRGEDRVAVVLDGEGATSSGSWHEGVVVAAAKRCPLVVVIEASDPSDPEHARHSRLERYTGKAPAYGLGAESVDGGDVLAVASAVRRAAERARAGEGVQLVEVRYVGTDPVAVLRARILAEGIAAADDLAAIEREAADACATALVRARAWAPAAYVSLPGVYTEAGRIERKVWRHAPPTQAV